MWIEAHLAHPESINGGQKTLRKMNYFDVMDVIIIYNTKVDIQIRESTLKSMKNVSGTFSFFSLNLF